MGLLDKLRGAAKEVKWKARMAGASIKSQEDEKRQIRAERREYKYQQREKEEQEYKKRQKEAERQAKQLAIKEMEVKNREKMRELQKRNIKAGTLGTLIGAGKMIANADRRRNKRRSRSRSRRQYYESYDNYRPPRRNRSIDDIDREFDKFF